MGSKASEFRVVTDEANLQKQKKDNKLNDPQIREGRKEGMPAKNLIYQEIKQASNNGEYSIRIPIICAEIVKLSNIAFRVLLFDLQEEGFKVEVYKDMSMGMLEPGTFRAYDIEGYEEYCEEFKKRVKHFTRNIIVCW